MTLSWLAFVLAAASLALGAHAAGPPPGRPAPVALPLVPYLNTTKVTVCVSDWTPAVYCLDKEDPRDYSGFEVELFRRVISLLGWTEEMLEWRCMGWDDMMDDLYNSTSCDLAPSGMQPRAERIDGGLGFSVSSIRTGYSIMVLREEAVPNMWYFLSAMSTQVWVAIILTGLVVGLVVWLFEVGMRRLNHDTRFLGNVMWDTLGRPVQMRDYRLASTPANVTALTWSFLVYICMAIYAANLTANLTVSQIKNDIRGIGDLPGKAVASWTGYLPALEKYNVAAKGYPWDNAEDERSMIDALKAGQVKAVVLDDSTLQIIDAGDCSTAIVGEQVDGFDQCVGFPPKTWANKAFIDTYNSAMLQVIEQGGVEELTKRFIKLAPASCKSSTVEDQVSAVSWTQVSGLWVLLAVAVGASALAVGAYRAWLALRPNVQHRRWFACLCPCCVPKSRLSRSLSSLVRSGIRQPRLDRAEQELWENKYRGASAGYVDGTTDMEEVLSRQRRVPSMARCDTASERCGDSAFQEVVLSELAELRAQLAQLRGGTGCAPNGSAATGDAPVQQHVPQRLHFQQPPPQQGDVLGVENA